MYCFSDFWGLMSIHKCCGQRCVWNLPRMDSTIRPSHTAAIKKTITITMQREHILFIEWAWAYSVWSNSTNTMRSLVRHDRYRFRCSVASAFIVKIMSQVLPFAETFTCDWICLYNFAYKWQKPIYNPPFQGKVHVW